MALTNKQLVASVKQIDKQIESEEGILRELMRDRVGTKSAPGMKSLDADIKRKRGILAELKRDRNGTLNQIR